MRISFFLVGKVASFIYIVKKVIHCSYVDVEVVVGNSNRNH
jgi:hypothetical protein